MSKETCYSAPPLTRTGDAAEAASSLVIFFFYAIKILLSFFFTRTGDAAEAASSSSSAHAPSANTVCHCVSNAIGTHIGTHTGTQLVIFT